MKDLALAGDRMAKDLATQLLEILGEHAWFMSALDIVSDPGLSNWCVGAGVIRNIVFDYLDERSTTPARVDLRTCNARAADRQFQRCWKSAGIINKNDP